MNATMIGGTILILLALLGFAIPFISTQQTQEVARVGDLKLQTSETKTYAIPPLVSGGALVLGVALVGAGLYRKS